MVWTVINEIYPSSVRGRAVSVARAASWGAAWLVEQFFLSLTEIQEMWERKADPAGKEA